MTATSSSGRSTSKVDRTSRGNRGDDSHPQTRVFFSVGSLSSLCCLDVFTSCGLTVDAPSPASFSVTTTRGRTQSQYTPLHTHAYAHVKLLFDSWSVNSSLSSPLSQGSFLAVPDNWSGSEPGAENVVHCFLDLFTDHQVILHTVTMSYTYALCLWNKVFKNDL